MLLLFVTISHADVQTLRSSSPVGFKPSVGVKPVFPPKPGSKPAADVATTKGEERTELETSETSVG
jgi:hypothetical protein